MKRTLSILLLCVILCGPVFAAADEWSLDFELSNVQYVRDNTTGFPANSSSNLNVALWAKFESLAADMAFFGTDVTHNDLWLMFDVDPGRLNLRLGDPTAGTAADHFSSSWSPSTDEWYFVAATYTYSNSAIHFYIDGSELSNTTASNAWRNSAGNFDVGAVYASWDTTDYTWMPFDGEIAGLIITTGTTWNSTAISNLYNSGSIDTGAWSSQSSIVRHYTFEEGTGTSTTNGNGANTATLSGVTGTPTWTEFESEPDPIYATDFSPADEATGQNRTVKLSWTDDATAAGNKVYGGTSEGSLSLLRDTNTQEWLVVPNLSPGVYYWRVDQVDAEDNETTGTVWEFTVTGKVGVR